MNKRGTILLLLTTFSVVPLLLAGCQSTPTITGGIAIEALCRTWGDSLPTRSREDSEETQRSIAKAYDVYEAVCQSPVE